MLLAVLIALGSLLLTACGGTSSLAAEPAATRPVAQAAPAVTRTPSGIFISTSVPAIAVAATSVVTSEPDSAILLVQGRIFDAASGQRLSNAAVEWQFLATDRQQYNGQLRVPADGLYRLPLSACSEDEVLITARAPGYLPSNARLHCNQLNPYGSRLNFGLVKTNGPVPTVPGTLGTIQLNGIVYNSARGLTDPIANARITVVNRSVVQPESQIETTTGLTGTFAIPMVLHSTDQIDVTIAASGYLTTTLSRKAAELARQPQLSIGLMPAPKP